MQPVWTDSFTEPPSWAPELGESAMHVWAVGLAAEPSSLHTLLSPDEVTAAGRFRFVEDRRRYVVARGSLRRILAVYADAPPARLQFRYGDRGKPHLEGHHPLEFNLTHAGDLALVAVTRIGPVGVDVERLRPIEDLLGLARRNFSAGEYATLANLPEAERLDSFLRCWTRKESYVKAVGDGLALPLGEFEVSFASGDRDRFLSIGGSRSEARSWFLHGFRPAAGYLGALAVQGQPTALMRWIWQRHRVPMS